MNTSNHAREPIKLAVIDLWADPGTRNYTAPLANALAARSDVSLILYLNRKTALPLYAKALEKSSLRLFRAPIAYRPALDLLLQPLGIVRLLLSLLRDKPDIIHLTFMHPWLTALLPILHLRFPIAITWHDLRIHQGETFLRHRLAQWAQKKYARILFVHSEQLQQKAIQQHAISPERVFVVPHGTYDHWSNMSVSDSPEEPATFLFFGRILPYKAPDVLFKAFKILLGRCPSARLIVAGAGDLSPYQDLMQNIEEHLEIHNRFVPENEGAMLFKRASATVLCHREVSQSGIVFASASMKKVVIASRVGALAETIQNMKTGLLITPNDPQALADAMLWMIDHPEERKQMGEALHAWIIETHGPETVAEATIAGYTAAVTAQAKRKS